MQSTTKEVNQGCDERLRPLPSARATSPVHQLVLCARVLQSDNGPEFETAIRELAKALDLYLSLEDAKGAESAEAKIIA